MCIALCWYSDSAQINVILLVCALCTLLVILLLACALMSYSCALFAFLYFKFQPPARRFISSEHCHPRHRRHYRQCCTWCTHRKGCCSSSYLRALGWSLLVADAVFKNGGTQFGSSASSPSVMCSMKAQRVEENDTACRSCVCQSAVILRANSR